MKIKFKGNETTQFTEIYGIAWKAGDVIDVTDDLLQKAVLAGKISHDVKTDWVIGKLKAHPMFEVAASAPAAKAKSAE